jgi:ADP-ribose pyrophosphatase YjhB (NUDIX family)
VTTDWTATLPGKRMGAALLLRDSDDRILLVEPTYKPYWELPGGVVEAGESPWAAAAREITEELGLSVVPGRLLVVDWVPPRTGRTEGVMFIYSGGVMGADQERDIVLPGEELRSWAWCTQSQADDRLSELLARRLRAAVRALSQDTTSYLENGIRVA